jgi:hypothetical protein
MILEKFTSENVSEKTDVTLEKELIPKIVFNEKNWQAQKPDITNEPPQSQSISWI